MCVYMLQVQHPAREQLGLLPHSTPVLSPDMFHLRRLAKNEILLPLQHAQTLHAHSSQVQRRLERPTNPRQDQTSRAQQSKQFHKRVQREIHSKLGTSGSGRFLFN